LISNDGGALDASKAFMPLVHNPKKMQVLLSGIRRSSAKKMLLFIKYRMGGITRCGKYYKI
jgi:hypothetical protein